MPVFQHTRLAAPFLLSLHCNRGSQAREFQEVVGVLEAAKKYSLDAIKRTACRSMFSPEILEVNLLRRPVVACHHLLPDECIVAAKSTLREPLVRAWFEEIELVTSTNLRLLLVYHVANQI